MAEAGLCRRLALGIGAVTPVPFSNALEDIYIPDAQRVVNAVKTVTGWSR